MRIDHYFHGAHDGQVDHRLDQIIELIHQVLIKEDQMANELADLQAKVAAEDTVIDSAIVLLQGIKAALAALSTDIGAKTQALSDAVVANTPATP